MRISKMYVSSPYHRELFSAVCTAYWAVLPEGVGDQDIVLGGDADVIAVKTQQATVVAMLRYNMKVVCTEQECLVQWYDREGRRDAPAQILANISEDIQRHIQVVATDGTTMTAWEWLTHHRRR